MKNFLRFAKLLFIIFCINVFTPCGDNEDFSGKDNIEIANYSNQIGISL